VREIKSEKLLILLVSQALHSISLVLLGIPIFPKVETSNKKMSFWFNLCFNLWSSPNPRSVPLYNYYCCLLPDEKKGKDKKPAPKAATTGKTGKNMVLSGEAMKEMQKQAKANKDERRMQVCLGRQIKMSSISMHHNCIVFPFRLDLKPSHTYISYADTQAIRASIALA
jgi:hypothetical protein